MNLTAGSGRRLLSGKNERKFNMTLKELPIGSIFETEVEWPDKSLELGKFEKIKEGWAKHIESGMKFLLEDGHEVYLEKER